MVTRTDTPVVGQHDSHFYGATNSTRATVNTNLRIVLILECHSFLNKPVMSCQIVRNVTCDLLSNIGWHCLSLVHCMEVSITSHITTTTTITTSFTCMTIIDKDKRYLCYPCDFTNKCSTMLQWNLVKCIMKSQGTDKIWLLKQGFAISRFFLYILLLLG